MCVCLAELSDAEFTPSGKSSMNDSEALRAVYRFHVESQASCTNALNHFAITADAIMWQRKQRPDALLFSRWAEKARLGNYLVNTLAGHFWPDGAVVEDIRLADPLSPRPLPIALASQVDEVYGTTVSFVQAPFYVPIYVLSVRTIHL